MTARVRTIAVLLAVFAAVPLLAQSSAESNARLQFNLLNPGALSLGMGGAFIGGADDATAAYANPAGLVNITRPEVSLESRMWKSELVAPFRGHAFGPKTGTQYDDHDGIEERRFENKGRSLAFGSFVFPFERWSVAVYQHELVHYDSSPQSQGIFFTLPGEEGELARARPSKSDLRLRIISRGAAVGYRITQTVSLGLDVSRSEMELDSRTDRYGTGLFAAPDFRPENIETSVVERGRDSAMRYGMGMTWDISQKLRVGAVYRREPEFPVTVTAADKLRTSECGAKFHVPDVYGAGLSYRFSAFLTFNADYNRVRYSELTEDFVTFPSGGCQTEKRATDFITRDANEYHTGVRYTMARNAILRNHPLILTAGWWREAPHALETTSRNDLDSVLFAPAGPNHHYSAGIGIVLASHVQLSVGGDVSDRQRILSLSTLARW